MNEKRRERIQKNERHRQRHRQRNEMRKGLMASQTGLRSNVELQVLECQNVEKD
jgi:hypothetical protein